MHFVWETETTWQSCQANPQAKFTEFLCCFLQGIPCKVSCFARTIPRQFCRFFLLLRLVDESSTGEEILLFSVVGGGLGKGWKLLKNYFVLNGQFPDNQNHFGQMQSLLSANVGVISQAPSFRGDVGNFLLLPTSISTELRVGNACKFAKNQKSA